MAAKTYQAEIFVTVAHLSTEDDRAMLLTPFSSTSISWPMNVT